MNGADPVRCMPVSAWPIADRIALERAQCDDDLLNDAGAFARLRPITLRKRCSDYGRWLDFLATYDAAALELAPTDRITPERVANYHAHLATRNAPLTAAYRVLGLRLIACAFEPASDWLWLRRLANRLTLRAKPVRNRRPQLRPPQEVLAACLRLMNVAETGNFTSEKKRALAFRDALLIGILATRAPRLSNLGRVEIDSQLVHLGERWCLRFDGTTTKNGDPWETLLPEDLNGALDRYLAHWRPLLLSGARSNRLWITATGRPIRVEDIHEVVTRRTKRLFGIAINPHCFRAALLTEIAIRDPEHVAIAAPILNHRASKSARYYNLAGQHEAARDWQEIVLQHRREARRRRG